MFEKIKIKLKEREYKKYIEQHREYIKDAFIEVSTCPDLDWIINQDISCKLFERIQKHDLSKYSKEEFDAYRRYYHPISKEEKNNAKQDFDKAWEHHWKNNDHHWQCRQNDTTFTEETKLAILENVCDWLAMGYKFHDRPIQYYNKHKQEIILPIEQKELLEKIICDLEKTKRDMSQYGTL
ncbi:MAG: DUF5662 family protein [Bacilli bacterium]